MVPDMWPLFLAEQGCDMNRVVVTAMELPMRRWVLMWGAVFVLQTSAHAADKIRISMTGFAGQFMTFPLAQKRGFLKEEGIEAEIVRISAAAGRAALSSGEVDYSTGIGGTAIGGALTGLPIRVVACFVPAPVLALVARPEYKSVPALKGKTIGILIAGGVAHFAARAIVKHFGLDPEKDLKYVAVGPPDARFAALVKDWSTRLCSGRRWISRRKSKVTISSPGRMKFSFFRKPDWSPREKNSRETR